MARRTIYKSIKSIAIENGISQCAIYKRLIKRKLPYRKMGGLVSIKKDLITELLKLKRDFYKYSDLKIDVITLLFQNMNVDEISGYFGVQKHIVNRYIAEWENTGCVVVQSKMNRE